MRRVLAIIPAYNEEESLQTTVEELKAVAPDIDFVVVNDGSSDDTAGVCRRNSYPMIDLPFERATMLLCSLMPMANTCLNVLNA